MWTQAGTIGPGDMPDPPLSYAPGLADGGAPRPASAGPPPALPAAPGATAPGPGLFVQFGGDVAVGDLPSDFGACLPPYGSASASCDVIVGSTMHGSGYCSTPPYSTMSYCACVNNAIGCPMLAATACANNEFAYRPTDMLAPSGQAYLACKDTTICNDIIDVYGSENVVTGITQDCGKVTDIRQLIGSNPAIAILIFLFVVVLAFLLAGPSDLPKPRGHPGGRRPQPGAAP